MKKFIFVSFSTLFLLQAYAQVPQIHIPAVDMQVSGDRIASDGNTIYFLRRNTFTSVVSVYKIDGNNTTPNYVADLYKEDTVGIPVDPGTLEFPLKQFEVVNGKMVLLYFKKASASSTSFTGWGLLVSDGTAAGTGRAFFDNTPIGSITNSVISKGLFKTNDGVFVQTTSLTTTSPTPPIYQSKIYKCDGSIAGASLIFTSPADEQPNITNATVFDVKNNWVYFTTQKFTGTTMLTYGNYKYYRTNGTLTQTIGETNSLATAGGNLFMVGDNDILVGYRDLFLNTTLGTMALGQGYKIISLATFTETATFAPLTSSFNGEFADSYDNVATYANGTYYVKGISASNKGLYLFNTDNSTSFWAAPLNAGFVNTATPLGALKFKRADTKVYMEHFYSAHKYTKAGAYAPTHARTSSLYYLNGVNPILIDSITNLEGTLTDKTTNCGDVIYNETIFQSAFPPNFGFYLDQNKLWKCDGTKAGTGFYANLHECSPLSQFYLPDFFPTGLIKHNGEIKFIGFTGCTYADGNALYKISNCNSNFAMFKSAANTTITSNANYVEANRILPYSTLKADSALVAIYPNGLSLGNINTTVFNEASNIITSGYTFLRRHYLINPATDPAGNKKIRLYFSTADFAALQIADPTITSINQLQVVKYDGPTEDGTYDASDATSLTIIAPSSITTGTEYGVNYLEFDVTGFSEFWISKANAALPVDITLFTGKLKNDNDVQLQWQTENEINVKEYQLQSSDDGINFKPAATIVANNAVVYNYTDAAVQWIKAAKYYRLKILDNDSRFKYSPIIRINKVNSTAVTVYPNPASSYIIAAAATKVQQIKITDAAGKLVLQYKGTPGNRYNIARLSKGLYTLQIFLANELVTQKLLVQ